MITKDDGEISLIRHNRRTLLLATKGETTVLMPLDQEELKELGEMIAIMRERDLKNAA